VRVERERPLSGSPPHVAFSGAQLAARSQTKLRAGKSFKRPEALDREQASAPREATQGCDQGARSDARV